jgi:methylenetetrahydrofolate reductase (NADPH)
MKVTQHLAEAKGNTLVSFEILPPLKGATMQSIFNILDPLMEYKPPFIDVTYHREEYVYKQRPSGYFEKSAIRKRPGTVGICAAIMHRYGVDAVPHLICGGFSKDETENALIDLNFLGIQNILALRGDARKFEASFTPHPEGHAFAVDLVKQCANMNTGKFLDDSIIGAGTDFCVGVAGYPEKHFEAPNLSTDLLHLKAKVDAGADYIVTQMFFDNKKYFNFVAACREMGIHVPIIPGLKPVTSLKQLISIPRVFFLDFPDDLVKAMLGAKDDAAVKQVGVEWCIAQSRELKAAGVPLLHYYTMGDIKTIKYIIDSTL